MPIDTDPTEPTQSASSDTGTRGATAAQHVVRAGAMANNTTCVAELSSFASGEQRAEPMRGIGVHGINDRAHSTLGACR